MVLSAAARRATSLAPPGLSMRRERSPAAIASAASSIRVSGPRPNQRQPDRCQHGYRDSPGRRVRDLQARDGAVQRVEAVGNDGVIVACRQHHDTPGVFGVPGGSRALSGLFSRVAVISGAAPPWTDPATTRTAPPGPTFSTRTGLAAGVPHCAATSRAGDPAWQLRRRRATARLPGRADNCAA